MTMLAMVRMFTGVCLTCPRRLVRGVWQEKAGK
jgi:hypothetical protein